MTEHPSTRRPNRLAASASPYLLQHAYNPVDWREWGDEAFAEARRRDVPIFLSIGYSSCYWCHVMERESFESGEIASLMNDRFVCIKVDREERPDVDEIYMAATVTMTGRGGWPMSVFLEPGGLRPFWCGTYFPPKPNPSLGSIPAFPQILAGMSGAWRDQRDDVLKQAEQVAGAVREQLAADPDPVEVGQSQVQQAISSLLGSLDRTNGGFGGAPKFPQPVFLELLLDASSAADDEPTRVAIDHSLRLTLDQMALGGIFDHAGGGFHRYAVDATWTVPHFEKMLYDNAQLGAVYARAATVYDDDFYGDIARRTLEYVLREMTTPDGAFFSAQDAEVDGREGLNYIWSLGEVRDALGDDAQAAADMFGLDCSPNFRDPHHPGDDPSFVLRLGNRPGDTEVYRRVCDKLYQIRSGRKQPRLDDKVLTSWSGLMIAAFCAGAEHLGDQAYKDAAVRAAEFVLGTMRTPDGDLIRSWRNGVTGPPGQLEDYAFLAHGLLALHRVEGSQRWLDAARELIDRADSRFGDGLGGFYDTDADRDDLFVRARSTHDGAVPSASGVMLANLVDLADMGGDYARAVQAMTAMSAAIASNPLGSANSCRSLLRLLRSGNVAPGTHAQPESQDHFTPVEIYADAERISVADDKPSVVNIVVRIADGYHIVAADQPENGPKLQPLRVGLIPGSGSGVVVFGDYPKGEPYGAENELNAHFGEIEFAMLIERKGEWTGRPMLGVTFQACSDTECLAPTTVTLDVAIDRA